MDWIEERTELPRFTRLVHAAFLSGIEGVSLGFALATSLYSSRLVQFVKTNRIEAKLRKEMLSVVILPSLLLPMLIVVTCLASARFAENRINTIERRVRLLSPICAAGFLPLLLKPNLWSEQALAFLLVTGVFAVVVTATVRLSALTWLERHPARAHGDLEALKAAVKLKLSPRVLSTLALCGLAIIALVSVIRTFKETSLTGTAFNSEWSTLHSIAASSGTWAWFGEKGWRITGHFGLIGALYSLVGSVASRPEGLLLFRLFAVSFASLPLFLWTKRTLGTGAAFIISVAYLSMPITGMLATRDSFPVSVGVGFFFLAAHYLEGGKLTKGLVVVALGMLLNEQLAIWFSLLGVYLSRPGHRKVVGQALAVGSLSYFLVVALFLLPRFGIGTYGLDKTNIASIGVQNLGVTLTSALVNPAYTLSRWFEIQNLEFWLALTVPMALLPFKGQKWLLWLCPVLLFASTATSQEPGAQWRDPVFAHFLALGFLAVVGTLQWVRRSSSSFGPLRFRAALIGWLAALAPCITMFGTLYYGR